MIRKFSCGVVLEKVWKAVLSDPVVFKGKSWVDISADAKDFVTTLLNK